MLAVGGWLPAAILRLPFTTQQEQPCDDKEAVELYAALLRSRLDHRLAPARKTRETLPLALLPFTTCFAGHLIVGASDRSSQQALLLANSM